MGFQQLPSGVLTIVVTLVFMFRLNPLIAGVVTVLTPFSVWMAKFISSHASRHFAGQTQLRGELTGLVEEMIGGADTIEEIKTICWCGRKATFNARLDGKGGVTKQGEQVVLGASDRYVSLCRKHWKAGDLGPGMRHVDDAEDLT